MSRLVWDEVGKHIYENGVRQGVLFVQNDDGTYRKGVAWNGLTAVTESPSGAETTALYADDIKYLNMLSAEEFGATIEAYTYPDEFMECDGSGELADGVHIGQQARRAFAFCYRTVVGNESAGENFGHKLHIIYGAMASPSEKAYQTINDSPEAITFSWEISTTPVSASADAPAAFKKFKPTASIVLDSTKMTTAQLAYLTAVENSLYGTDGTTDPEVPGTDPTLLLPEDIYEIFNPSSAG